VNAKTTIPKSEFIPPEPFPEPLNFTWATTKGADLIWTPMPFVKSLQIAYSRTRYGTGYYIYHLFPEGRELSHPLSSWDLSQIPDRDVLELLGRAGTDIAPRDIRTLRGSVKLNRKNIMLADISAPVSRLRAIKLTIPLEYAGDLERARLLITWDGREQPSVDAPLCLFFGAGTLYNREKKEYLVKAFPVNIRYDYQGKKVELACYFPMPFRHSARIELAGIDPVPGKLSWEIRYEPQGKYPELNAYFHASYKDIPSPEPGMDMVFLDTKGMEGSNEWSGSFVGTSFIFSHRGILNTLEGDPRFFFDDSRSPQAYGTGTEEWGGGGDYWGGENMTLPLAGHPCGIGRDRSQMESEKDLIESAYRFLLADLMPFGRRAVIRLEHGRDNLSTEHYEAVTYWYGSPFPVLVKTDEIDIGDPESEKQHAYHSPAASPVESVLSRFEWGIDVFPDRKIEDIPDYPEMIGKEVYPAHREDGRFTRGISEFTVKIDPENRGVMLRRTLDYSFPNQTAEVYVSDASAEQGEGDTEWEYAGIWYLAGGNIYLYSNPKGELDPQELNIQISNRRFRDDEFLVPADLTEKKSALRIRLRFIPDNTELYPRMPYPKESAWSELGYQVYCYMLPPGDVPLK